jgi:hypothetical protein
VPGAAALDLRSAVDVRFVGMRVPRSAGGLIAVVLMLGAGTAVASAAPEPPSEAELANQAAAEADAPHLLEQLRVPPGANPSPTEPPGASPLLDKAPWPESSKLVNLTSWWTVPGEPEAVLDWIKANPPQESILTGGGSTVTLGNGADGIKYAAFAWPPVPSVLSYRSLLATVGAGAAGTTILRADAMVAWFVPRPTSERVPASAHVLEVAEKRHRGDRSITILKSRAVRRIITLVNELPISQPAARFTSRGPIRGCPRRRGSHRMQLTFRRRRNGPPLAEASQEFPPGYCHPMYLKIRGYNRPEPPLEDSYTVIRALRPLLAARRR